MKSRIDTKNIEVTIAGKIKKLTSQWSEPIIVAVGGPGGTGKTSFSRELARCFVDANVLSLDDYKTHRKDRQEKNLFGPHPEANEMEVIEWHLEDIKNSTTFFKPVYDPAKGFAEFTELFIPAKINIVEGEVATYLDFRDIVDISIYIDADMNTQLNTRLTRDIEERGYTMEKALETFLGSNVKEFRRFGSVSKEWADMVVFCKPDYSLEIQKI